MFDQIWAGIDAWHPLARVGETARRAEAIGYDGIAVPDASHDGFLLAAFALAATSQLRVRTSGLVAFARNPMTAAIATWDLRATYGKRFELGLGPLIKSILVSRYGMSWSPPAPRMREYVQLLRAIFDCWQNGTPLRFLGKEFRLTRMQDFMKPPPLEHPDVPIHLAGIGPQMTALAGELADGLATHPTNSAPIFLREVTLPNLERGAARTQRSRAKISLHVNPFCATGIDAASVRRQREKQRRLLAVLYSTPEYWHTLDLLGYRDRGELLNSLVRQQRWDELPPVITDEILEQVAPAGTYDELPSLLHEWYGGLADSIGIPMPADPGHDQRLGKLLDALRG